MAYTPAMQQYLNVKENYKDCILFFRMGDFYEMFFDDALIASRDMDVVLTSKACGENERAPMCGIPYHAAENYISRLIEKGHKVAIAEQIEDPALAKGIVERDVIRVVTPGTVTSSAMLNESENSYLCTVYSEGSSYGLSWCDISTGEFCAMQLSGESASEQLSSELIKISPKEIICNVSKDEAPELWQLAEYASKSCISVPDFDYFGENNCRKSIRRHFNTASEKSAGLAKEDSSLLFSAVGAILGYLIDTQKKDIVHLRPLEIKDDSPYMHLDKSTVRNLELTETIYEHSEKGSLLGVIDRTQTAMGSRLMKQWLKEPLIDKRSIDARLDAVEVFCEDYLLRNDIRCALKGVYDLERLSARLSLGTANARDLIALKNSLMFIGEIRNDLAAREGLLKDYADKIDPETEIAQLIEAAIVDEPPFSVREGEMIKPGYCAELDDIKDSAKDGRTWIASLEAKEKERTGLKNLRVGFNKVFGYYIEISKGQADQAPADYIRKQTLVNAERFITPELKEMENLVLNARTKTDELEYRLFTEIRSDILQRLASIQQTALAVSAVDVLAAFAESSVKLEYTRPELNDGDEIKIIGGRHPVIEQMVDTGSFVSNDLYLNRSDSSMLIITGPNMSGKSTYMRQLALIVLLAQAGCFVPAQSASIGICDRIYTRIGASDNLAFGQSTFFVEMSELAYILNTASERSLIILDEIGRGTSTYDGLSIAWATVEYLSKASKRIRTLFATHYHELTALEESIEGVRNLNVDVSEENGSIVFLHKIVEGCAERSYAVHVAKLAGVRKEVLEAADRKLAELECAEKPAIVPGEIYHEPEQQMSMFSPREGEILAMLKDIDIMNVTPAKAIELLQELKEAAEK